MTKPIRIKHKRGVALPDNTTYVGRPTPWGNKTKVGPGDTNHFAVACFRDDLRADPELVARIKKELKGKNLACYCELSEECHADVLLALANGKEWRW